MKKINFPGNRKGRCFLIVLMLVFICSPLFAQRKITVRLASLVPENTAWGSAINRLAAEWSRITNGEVEVIVFHNGTAGGEQEVLRKLRMDQIQAAVLTSLGMSSMAPQVMTLSYPFLIRNDTELNTVMNVVKPELDVLMQQSGYVTLAWANAGWVNIFSKTPVFVPADLRRMRLGSAGTNEQFDQAFKSMGFNIVQVPLPEVLMGLNSNRIDSTYLSPIYAAGNQVFGIAKNMMSINVAPFMGGIVINNTTWRRIPERYRNQLLAVCRQLERNIVSSTASLEADAISAMTRYGLVINELNSQQVQEWYNEIARYENNLIGGANPLFDRAYYQRIKTILDEYRRGR